MTHCVDCNLALTQDELHYYDNRCEKCERILWGQLVDDGEVSQLKAKLEEATGLIEALLGLELGSGERALAFLSSVGPALNPVDK